MNKALLVFLLFVASAITACDIPPPPDEDVRNGTEEVWEEEAPAMESEVRSEAIATSQGVIIRFVDGRFQVQLPPGFDTPGFDSIRQQRIIINRHIARSGNRLAMAGWNEHDESFFETTVLDSFLNVAKFTTLRQMEGELVREERFTYRGYPCIRFVIRYQDADREVTAPATAVEADDIASADEAAPAPREKIDVYSRYEYIIAPPYLFQMTFSTPDLEELDSEEINAFFGSFEFDIEPYNPDMYD